MSKQLNEMALEKSKKSILKDDDKVEPAPSSDKSPPSYDSYEFKSGKEFKEIAKIALHETDEVRDQALTQLREWIKKDPRIIACRTDAPFLLRFLRVKKFNITESHTMIHRYLTNRQLYSSWYRELNVEEPCISELLDLGVLTPLRKRDSKGRQIWIYEVGHMDPDKHTSTDFFRLQEILYQTCIDDEETQISGLVCVFNYAGVTMKHTTMFPLLEFKNHISCIRKSIPMRIQASLVLNLPLLAQAFYETTCLLISPKLRERFKVFKNLEELQKVVDVEYFPERYGGKEKQEDLIADFKRKMYLKRDKIKALEDMTVDLSKNVNKNNDTKDSNGKLIKGIVGSFRKLQVD